MLAGIVAENYVAMVTATKTCKEYLQKMVQSCSLSESLEA